MSEGNLQKRFWQRPLFFEAIAKREFQSKFLGLAGEYGIDHPTYSVESSPEWQQRRPAHIPLHLEPEP